MRNHFDDGHLSFCLQLKLWAVTDDGLLPASPNMYYTTIVCWVLVCKVMQDIYHQQWYGALGNASIPTDILQLHQKKDRGR